MSLSINEDSEKSRTHDESTVCANKQNSNPTTTSESRYVEDSASESAEDR